MRNFFRHIFKGLTTSKSRPSYFLCPPQLIYLEDRITPSNTPIIVTTTLDTDNSGDNVTSLREAITLANANAGDDTIDFASSLFSGGAGTITLLTASLPQILDATQLISGVARGTITITGPGASSLTISGDNGVSGRNFNIFNIASGGDLSISGVTVSGANTSANGGGFNNAGTLSISNSTLSGNTANNGGGIWNNTSATLSISNSTLSGNSAQNGGGGIFNISSSTVTVTNSTLSGNTARFGGGIWNNGTLTLTNSTLSGNSASINGGGGIYNRGIGLSRGTLNIANTIIANSTSGGDYAGGGTIGINTNNLVETLGTVTGTFIPAFTADPRLGPLQDNGGPTFTMALGAGSPAIGTSAGTGTDQRGINRITNDIGAYSFGIAVTNTTDNLTSPSVGSLRAAINLANTTPGNDQISVNLTGANPYTITLAAALPNIINSASVIRDSNSQPIGTAGTVTITGLGASSLTISGDNGVSERNFNIFNIASGGNLSISEVTVSGAKTSGNGGAFNNFGTLAVTNSTISGNTASNGGGIWNDTGGTVTVTNSELSANIANDGNGRGSGGGIYNSGTLLTLTNSTLSGNTAYSGGGISNESSLTISNSTFFGNSATFGGGIENFRGIFSLNNSTLSGNSAIQGVGRGGAIYNKNLGTISNSTLSGNSAIQPGGGIYNGSTLNITNTIIANSTSGGDYAGSGTVNLIGSATAANNLVTQTGLLVSGWATTKSSSQINLGLLQNNGGPNLTMALGAGSAAIGKGNSTISNASPINGLDQRGFARTTSDIGSYAYIAPTVQNDVVVAVNTSGQVGLFLSSAGTAITDLHTAFAGNIIIITAITTGDITGSGTGITIDNTAKTITVDLTLLSAFSGILIVGNSGADSVTIGTGGVDLSAITTGAANLSFTANILGTSNSTSALVLTDIIKTKGTAATYLSAGTINGTGLITTPSITLLANTGIGNTTALNLASQAIAADSSNGKIIINNTSASAVTVSSLTTKETNTNLGQLKIIQFAQTGGGDVTFSKVSTIGTAASSGSGEIELSNDGNLIVGAGGVVSDGASNIYIQTTNFGNIVLNGNVDAFRGDGAISLKSAGSISGTGALISGSFGRLEDLIAGTGIDVKTQGLDFSIANISTTTGDITIENTTSINNLPTIAAPANLSIKAGGTISQATHNNIKDTITVAGTASFNAVNGAIDLTSPTNNFSGAVSLTNTGNNSVAIVDIDDITIGVTSLGTGTFAVTGTIINLNNNVTTTNNSQTYTGNLVVNANSEGLPLTLSAGSGAINITGNINSAAGHNHSLTFTSTGDVTIGGTIGGTQALGTLLITGNDISLGDIGGANVGATVNVSVQASDGADAGSITLTGTTYNTGGQQFYNSSVNASSYDGTRPITLTGNSSGSMTVNMTSANGVATYGTIQLNNLILSLNTSGGNSGFVANEAQLPTLQVFEGPGSVVLDTGVFGSININGAIGTSGTPLNSMTITNAASAAFSGSIHTGNLIITDTTNAGTVNFQGDLTVTTGMTVSPNGAYNVEILELSTIAGETTFGNSGLLTLGNAGSDVFNFTGGIIATTPSAINFKGTITAGTGVITLGDSGTSINIKNGNGAVGGASTGIITLGNAILEDGVTLTVGTGIANTINMAAVTGTAGGTPNTPENLIINTTGAVTVAGAVGTSIGTLTITNSGGTTFQSTVNAATATITNTTGTVAFEDNLTLGTALVTTARGYDVSITGTSNSIAGATTFSNTGSVTINNASGPSGDTTTFTGGLVITSPASIAIQGTVATTNATMTLGGVALNGSTTLNAGTGNINLNGLVSGASLTPITANPGLTTISGANTNTTTNVTTGVVQISSTQSTNYAVSGGTLKGTGSIGNLTATGTGIIAPGNSPGQVTTTNLSLSSTNTLQIEIQGASSTPIAGTDYDQIVVGSTGTVNLGGAILNLSSTYTGIAGTVFTIIDNQHQSASIQGTFSGLSEGAVITANGSTYQISYVGGTGNDVTLTVYNLPSVTSFNPTIGKTGTPVVIIGSDFTKVSQVSFNGTAQPTYTVNSPTQITTTVPSGATTGTISITTIAGTATSTNSFTVDNTAPTLSISASPGSLKANETSTITFSFSEAVTGFSSSIITVTNGTITNPVASSNTVYTASFTPTLGIKADGTIAVSNNYFDLAGNQGTAATLTPPIAINTIQTPLVTGSASTTQGGSSVVSLVDPDTGAVIGSAVPFPGFSGPITVVSGDFNGDGVAEIIAGAGFGGGPAIAILNSQTGEVMQSFFAFDPAFTGGVFVAVQDTNGDGILDIIAAAGPGGGPEVRIFDGASLNVLRAFFAYDQSFTGGVSVATIDFNNDGILDLVTGAGPGGAPHVKVFDGATNAIISQWYAYPASFTGGVYVAAGDIGKDGNIEVVTGAGLGGAPVVAVWDPYTGALLAQFMAYPESFTGGVRVGINDGNGDGIADILTGAGPGGGPQVNVFSFPALDLLFSFYSGDPANTGGVFVS